MCVTLFVKANDRNREHAVSVMLYDAFLDSYTSSHSEDTIIELDLFKEELPYMNADMINGNYKNACAMKLTSKEQTAVEVASKYLEQFLAADKVIFAFPMWNMTIPAVLHTYLDYLNQAGKTFNYTAEGPVGLIPDKKIMLLHACGGVYSEGPSVSAEMSLSYIRNIMEFFGVTNINHVLVEGHHQFRDRQSELVAEGVANARNAALVF